MGRLGRDRADRDQELFRLGPTGQALEAVHDAVARIMRLVHLVDKQVDVRVSLVRCSQARLDAIHQMMTRVPVLSDALYQHLAIAVATRSGAFLDPPADRFLALG